MIYYHSDLRLLQLKNIWNFKIFESFILDDIYHMVIFEQVPIAFPVIHFLSAYITSHLGPFLSLYITFYSNIRALWSPYITFESNIQAFWSPYITLKKYTGSKLDPACAK